MHVPPPPSTLAARRPRGVASRLLYLASLPERCVRAFLGWLGRGALLLAAFLPRPLRESRFFRVAVQKQLHLLCEDFGGAVPSASRRARPPENSSMASRAVGGALDNALVLGLHVSPVWVLLALADTIDGARGIAKEIASELEREGVLPPGSRVAQLDQLLGQVAKISGVVAESMDAPPLSVDELKRTVLALRDEAQRIDVAQVVSARDLEVLWSAVRESAAHEQRSLLEASTGIALGSLARVGELGQLLGRSALATARAGGQLFWRELVASYLDSAQEIQRRGFFATLHRSLAPQTRGTRRSFDPRRVSWTELVLSGGSYRNASWRKR
ncbi:MAG: hypothetical protein JNM84_07730 [Planctomycetes bacterium]|nr:hypothetical protein [Planctomycetota bacterium]